MRASTRIVMLVAVIAAVGVWWHLRHRAAAVAETPAARARTVSIGGVRPPQPQSLDRPTTGYVVLDRETGHPTPK